MRKYIGVRHTHQMRRNQPLLWNTVAFAASVDPERLLSVTPLCITSHTYLKRRIVFHEHWTAIRLVALTITNAASCSTS